MLPTGTTSKLGLPLAIALGLLCLGGCTSPEQLKVSHHEEEAEQADSLAPFNRVMYSFNYGLDMLILKPITSGYRFIVPQDGRKAVSNVMDNLYSPVTFGNSVLQGDPQNSFATLWRFILNTTFGLGGVIDFASYAGLKNRPADFGETLAMYGVKSGPYLVLPFFGPSNIRDAVGRAGDAAMNPFTYAPYEVSIPYAAAGAVDTRSRNGQVIDDVYTNSVDPYETFRSAYTQKREADIRRALAERQKALEKAGGK